MATSETDTRQIGIDHPTVVPRGAAPESERDGTDGVDADTDRDGDDTDDASDDEA